MILSPYFKLSGKLIFILALFLLLSKGSIQAATSPDAVAFRVMPNNADGLSLSPLRWYLENIKVKGSPQALTVDGYEAVRDGRTVYVDAANISTSGAFLTNIYIISYNQAAENATIDIFGQILQHWKFNANIEDASVKAQIVRDTKRLADISDIKFAIADYQASHNGNSPQLLSGSYLAGKSISVWPSWRATLGAALGITMPLDPVNKLGACTNPAGFDPTTCWDQINKRFAGSFSGNTPTLPGGSRAYVYSIDTGGTYKLCAFMEYNGGLGFPDNCNNTTGQTQGIVVNAGTPRGYVGKDFFGFISAIYSGNDTLAWQIINNGGISNLTLKNTGEANKKQLLAASPSAGTHTVTIRVSNSTGVSEDKVFDIIINSCGDSIAQSAYGEQCDNGANNSSGCTPTTLGSTCTYCDANCQKNTNGCGDGNIDAGEDCDDGAANGTICTPAPRSYGTYCTASCQLKLVGCGDGIIQSEYQEQCDLGIAYNIDTECTPEYGKTCSYCDTACQNHVLAGAVCGDGIVDPGEDCDRGSGVGGNTNTPCTAAYGGTCTYCDTSCVEHEVVAAKCGDGTVDYGEECDFNASVNTKPCTGTPSGLPSYCSGLVVNGAQSCVNAGVNACKWSVDCELAPEVNNTSTGCNSTNAAVTADCCELTLCSQDGCGCCGSGEAIVNPGYATVAGGSNVATFDAATLARYPGCTGGTYNATYYSDLCISCDDKAKLCTPAGQGGDCWSILPTCKLNRSIANPNNWEITTSHSKATYRCWGIK